jgi:hypothetical protein
MSGKIKIKINGWENYNPRKDIKNPSWFAFSNRMIEDSDFYEMTHAEFKAWIYCLSRASQKNSDTIEITLMHANRICNILKSDFDGMFEKMKNSITVLDEAIRTDTYAPRTPDVQCPYTTNKQTDKQTDNQSDKSDEILTNDVKEKKESFDFDAVYNLYPRKEGKKKGLERLKARIKKKEDYEKLTISVKNYVTLNDGIEKNFLKHFDSFVSVWEDYVTLAQDENDDLSCKIDWDSIVTDSFIDDAIAELPLRSDAI